MNLRTVNTIFRKELLDTLRDKRTLIAMLAMPVVLYPALFIFATQAALLQTDKLEKQDSRVAVLPQETGLVKEWVDEIPQVRAQSSGDTERDLGGGRIDAVVMVEQDSLTELERGGSVRVTIQYDATEGRSRTAASRVARGLDKKADSLLDVRLEEAGLNKEYVEPLVVKQKNVASKTKLTGSVLGMILPVIMVLMVAVGAFYPAVDLTAGEKERGTFETLLSTPTAKIDIVCGKFLTVFCLAMVTGLLNLGSMTLTFTLQLAQLPSELDTVFELHLRFGTAALMFVILIPLAFFVSAAIMSVAVFARSFKEAQNYVMPLFLLITFPAALASIPGVKLGPATQFIPVANVALLFKELLMGTVPIEAVFAVLLSTATYALFALVLASWIFRQEEVMLSEESGVPVTLRREDFTPRPTPTAGLAMFAYTVCLLLLFYLGAVLQTHMIIAGLAITLWVFILIPPIALCWFTRIDPVQGLNLRRPSITSLIATLVIVLPYLVLLLQLSAWQEHILPIPEHIQTEMQRPVDYIHGRIGLLGMLALLALSPAICEEVLFRGFILSALRRRLPLWSGVIIVGLLFGAMHLNVHRLFAATLSGVVLTYLVWRSGSIVTSMIAHFIINGGLILLETNYIPRLTDALYVPVKDGGTLSPVVLGCAAAVLILGVVLMEWRTPRPSNA